MGGDVGWVGLGCRTRKKRPPSSSSGGRTEMATSTRPCVSNSGGASSNCTLAACMRLMSSTASKAW